MVNPTTFIGGPKDIRHEIQYSMTETNTMAWEMLPVSLQKFVTMWEGTGENEQYLWKAMMENALHISTDGSHIPDTTQGAGAGILAATGNDKNILRAGAKCDDESDMSSLTTEHYGMLSGICAMMIIIFKYGEPKGSTTVTIWTDNAALLQRMNKRNKKKLRLKEYSISDYGLYWLLC